MGMNMEALKELAEKMLEKSFIYNEFYKYAAGLLPFSITIPDGFGSEVECVSVKMEAIYDYYRKNPKSNIDKMLYDSLAEGTYKYKSMKALVAMLRMIEYQIVAENTKNAPFKIDNDTLLLNLRKNLQENKQLYDTDIYRERKFWEVMSQHNQDLMENHGRRIM